MSKKTDLEKKIAAYANRPGHRVPQTRREFLASGVISAATSLLAPSLTTLISRNAWAKNAGCESNNQLPAYINLQLAGGPAMFANHLAHGENGASLPNYAVLGVGNGPGIGRYFANNAPFFISDPERAGSGFLRGLRTRMGEEAFKDIVGGADAGGGGKAVFIAVACKSIDDALTNKHDLSGLLVRAGLGGGALPYLLYETRSGNDVNLGVNRFKGAYYEPPKYLMSQSVDAIKAGLGFKGALLDGLGSTPTAAIAVQSELAKAIDNLTKYQVESLLRAPKSSESRRTFMSLAHCATQKNVEVLKAQSAVTINIYEDSQYPALAQIWRKDFQAFAGGFDAIYKNETAGLVGTSVATAIKGLSGACTAVLGGYDYHAGQTDSRAAQDDKDQYFGEIVANILMTAKALNKPVFLYISADGSVSSQVSANAPNNQVWAGDYSERGMNYIIAYDPANKVIARPYVSNSYKDASFQLNHFYKNSADDLVVSNDNPIAAADAQELAAAAVFLNYLSFAKRKDIMELPILADIKTKLDLSVPGSAVDKFLFYSRIEG